MGLRDVPMTWLRKWYGAIIAGLVAVLYFVLRNKSDAQRHADMAEAQLRVEYEERKERERLKGLRDMEAARHEDAVAAIVRDAKLRAAQVAADRSKVATVAKGGDAGADALGELLGSD
jgi:hypothetical protein